MARLGVGLPVVEKILNHTGGSFAGIVGVYQRHDFADEKRQAMEVWAQHLLTFDIGPVLALRAERGPARCRRPERGLNTVNGSGRRQCLSPSYTGKLSLAERFRQLSAGRQATR